MHQVVTQLYDYFPMAFFTSTNTFDKASLLQQLQVTFDGALSDCRLS